MTVFENELWEFPKGKMFENETPVQCALREFEEETNIKKSNVILVKKAGLFEDAFIGNDRRTYQSIYYLGLIHQGADISFSYQPCPHGMRADYVSDEVMSIEWCTYEQAMLRCTPTKQVILKNIHQYLTGTS